MAVLGLQGVRGGVGTTTITAALAWSLQMLGENVLVVDACPDNLLRLSFNVDFTHRQGWARAMLDGQDWRDAGLRYTSQLDLLPFGQLSIEEQENPQHWQTRLSDICTGLQQLKASGRYQWILIDLPRGCLADNPPAAEFVRSLAGNRQCGCQLPYPTASASAAGWCTYFD